MARFSRCCRCSTAAISLRIMAQSAASNVATITAANTALSRCAPLRSSPGCADTNGTPLITTAITTMAPPKGKL
jgi:hypothetical protein